MLNYVAAYACGEAIAYIKSLIAAKKINGELQRHIEILIERNSFLENDLIRLQQELIGKQQELNGKHMEMHTKMSELVASRNEVVSLQALAARLEKARASVYRAQMKQQKKIADLERKLEHEKEWKETREKYQSDERTGMKQHKQTGAYYCPKCLNAEPPVEQPIPSLPYASVKLTCPVCGAEFPNLEYQPSGPMRTNDDFDPFHNL